jgi:nucleotide-binding universal stress UspA family protein
LELAQKYGGELLVTTALDAPQWFIEEYPEVAWPLMEKLEGQVEAVLEGSRRTGIEGQGWVRQGAAYRVITAVAEEQGAGVIIVGSHGRTGMKRLLMGSVTERVIGHATCPVLVVQDPEKGREKR